MRQLTLDLGERGYSIYVEEALLGQSELIRQHSSKDNVLILSNETIAPLYAEKLAASLSSKNVHHYLIADGEQYKSLDNFSKILDFLIQKGFRRNDTLIALGGGVVGDLGGFVAASYQRGMGFIQVPTSLLAQVDSSVGGKTAVNHPAGKNMVGAFYQPQLVLIDPLTLDTLPKREFISGLAEVAKYAMLGETKIKEILLNQSSKILARDKTLLSELIYLSCAKKAQIVMQDEKERGCRALLNLGHTFGHALERLTSYREYLHGEAVSIGMHMAINLALSKKMMCAEVAEEYRQLLNTLGLPDKIFSPLLIADILDAMKLDKKNISDKYRLVLPTDTSCAIVEEDDLELVTQAIAKQQNIGKSPS